MQEWLTEFANHWTLWTAIGFLGQFLFSMRFIVQWIATERARKVVLPQVFWWFSAAGGTILLVYAIQRHDPVIIVGQAAGLFIYMRNLYILYQPKHKAEDAAPPSTNPPEVV